MAIRHNERESIPSGTYGGGRTLSLAVPWQIPWLRAGTDVHTVCHGAYGARRHSLAIYDGTDVVERWAMIISCMPLFVYTLYIGHALGRRRDTKRMPFHYAVRHVLVGVYIVSHVFI